MRGAFTNRVVLCTVHLRPTPSTTRGICPSPQAMRELSRLNRQSRFPCSIECMYASGPHGNTITPTYAGVDLLNMAQLD
jgi:hypothetical protein